MGLKVGKLSNVQELLLSDGKHSSEYPDAALMWGSRHVPVWAYDHDAAMSEKSQNANYVVGPAVPLVGRVFVIFVLIYVINPIFTYIVIDCPEDDSFAKFPWWLAPFWCLAMLFLIRLEFKALKYIIVPQVRQTAKKSGFKVFGRPLRFSVWLTFVFGLSLLGHSSFVSNGLFLAKALKTDYCSPKVSEIWQETMRHSVFGNVPFVGEFLISKFSVLAVIVFLLQIPQFLYALACSVPTGDDYKTKGKVEYGVQSDACAKYDTLFMKQNHHGPALLALAEVCRMQAILFQHWSYITAKGWHAKMVMKELPRIVFKFFVFNLLTDSLATNLQASAIALNRATKVEFAAAEYGSHDGFDQTFFIMCLSLTMALKTLAEQTMLTNRLWDHFVGAEVTAEELDGLYSSSKHAHRTLCCHIWWFRCMGLGFFMMLVYAGVKSYMAIYYCPYGVWNLSGCVTLSNAT